MSSSVNFGLAPDIFILVHFFRCFILTSASLIGKISAYILPSRELIHVLNNPLNDMTGSSKQFCIIPVYWNLLGTTTIASTFRKVSGVIKLPSEGMDITLDTFLPMQSLIVSIVISLPSALNSVMLTPYIIDIFASSLNIYTGALAIQFSGSLISPQLIANE